MNEIMGERIGWDQGREADEKEKPVKKKKTRGWESNARSSTDHAVL